MDLTLSILAIVLGIIGLVGAIVPVIPGTVISFAGLLVASFADGSDIGPWKLAIWGVISFGVIVMDYILPGYFTKRFGGTKAGSIGATVGTIVGIFLGPVGILIGPFAGAVLGELLAQKLEFREAVKVGFGSLMSFLVGTLFKLIAGGFMLFYIIKDII